MARIKGKIAMITGAAQGMGEAHARMCIKEGAKVMLTDILEEKGEALAKELGDNSLFLKQDVTCAEDWTKVVEAAEKHFGPVNVLVNNAGITMAKSKIGRASCREREKR